MTNEELWQAALNELELAVSKANFITWFQNTSVADRQDGVVVLKVPNAFAKEWLEYKYHKFILKSLRGLVPEIRNVEYVISSEIPPLLQRRRRERGLSPQEEQLEFKELLVDRETNLNPRYTFDSFIVGPFNELAHAASVAVSKNLGQAYNPLFLYGGVGLGKTHLLQAIGNEIKKQEELFHIFNSLYEMSKQIVFSSDNPPHAINDLEERLKSRFAGGMVADIGAPEYESRLAILRSKSAGKENYINQEILEFIASTVQKNIRELEGALNAVVAKSKLSGRALSIPEVKEILDKNTQPKKIVTANHIIKCVAEFYDVNERTLFEKTRKKEIVKPRQVAMYLLREDYSGSYPYIGQRFGGRDHTTAIHAFDKISKELKKNAQLVEEMKRIRELYDYSSSS